MKNFIGLALLLIGLGMFVFSWWIYRFPGELLASYKFVQTVDSGIHKSSKFDGGPVYVELEAGDLYQVRSLFDSCGGPTYVHNHYMLTVEKPNGATESTKFRHQGQDSCEDFLSRVFTSIPKLNPVVVDLLELRAEHSGQYCLRIKRTDFKFFENYAYIEVRSGGVGKQYVSVLLGCSCIGVLFVFFRKKKAVH